MEEDQTTIKNEQAGLKKTLCSHTSYDKYPIYCYINQPIIKEYTKKTPKT